MSNELARYDAGQIMTTDEPNRITRRRTMSIEFPTPRTFEELMQVANLLAQSIFVPEGFKGKPGDVVAAVQYGSEIGLAPMQSLHSICVINGKPSIYGDAMLALVRSAVTETGTPVLRSIKEGLVRDDKGTLLLAYCEVWRFNEDEPTRREFSVDQAKRAGLWEKAGPWKQYPERMLQMRARALALRDVFADVLMGLMIAEEAQDIPAPSIPVSASLPASPPPSPLKAAQNDLLESFVALASEMGYDVSTRAKAAYHIRSILSIPETERPTTGDIERALARLREIRAGLEEDPFANESADVLDLDVPAATENTAAFTH